MLRHLTRWVLVALAACAACSRVPARPPELPAPVTRLYPHEYPIVWDTVRVDLRNDERLELDTIDKQGRFVAWERTNNLFLLLNSRNVVTVSLEPVGADNTRMVLQMSHQKYDTGGWSRLAGWYASPNVNAQLGDDIAARIDRRLGHTPGLADQISVTRPDPLDGLPAAGTAAVAPPPPRPAASQPAPERRGWRRLWPFGDR